MEIESLNKKYAELTPEKRIEELYNDFDIDQVVYTSSFGTTAAILLKLISSIQPKQPVNFLDTTYHFLETIEYKDALKEQLNLNIEEILPEDWKNEFTRNDRTWTKDPDLCCSINKVEPMDKIKERKDIWVSGLLAYQNNFRNNLNVFDKRDDIIKFYPIIDMTEEQVKSFFADNGLPHHPLEAQGYHSIGCAQCTVKGKGRAGRWSNTNKSECGLHL